MYMSFTKRGLPDDYDVVREFLATALHDDAELAVRLGAPVSLNRQGNVIYQVDFTHGFGVLAENASGTESSADLSNAAPRSGGISVYLAAGPTTGDYVRLVGGLRLPDALSMALEFALAVLESNTQLVVRIYVYDGTNRSEYAVKVVCSTGVAYAFNAIGDWETITTVPILETGWGIYHGVKLVVNNGTLQYRRLVIDETQIDLSDIEPQVSASTAEKLVQFTIELSTLVDVTKYGLLDDLIVTLNEI